MSDADLLSIAPALILAAAAIVVLLLGLRVGARALAWVGAAACAAAAAVALAMGGGPAGFAGSVTRDGAGAFFSGFVGVAAAASLVLVAADPRGTRRSAEQVALVLFSACGAVLLVSAADTLVLVVALGLLTVPLYPLMERGGRHRADKGSVPIFLVGAASSATVLYGLALLYAATGETGYASLGRATHNPLYLAGLGLVLAGSVVRLLGAPGDRSSVIVNVATIGALLRLVAATRSGDVALDWEVSLAVLAALAVTIAAVAAVAERRVRRLVTYATVSQLGYVAIAAAGSAAPAATFALVAYAAVAVGLFAVLAVLPRDEPLLADLAGLARQRPLLVLGLGVLVLGLIGIPPAAGFEAKVYVFEAGVRAQLLWLVVLAALATVVIAAAYLRVVLACFAPPRLDAVAPPRARLSTAVILVAALVTLAIGLAPGPLLDAAQAVRF
jgi:NADH-quinone oxidoreductase subunit N